MTVRPTYDVVQPALRRSPCQQGVIVSVFAVHSKLPLYGRSGVRAPQPGQWPHSYGTHRAFRAAISAAGNGAEAAKDSLAQSGVPQTSATKERRHSATQSVSKARAKVSDKLKAAVKQVDKQVHEVIAIPVAHNVALAPHMHEHPGEDTCILASYTAREGFSRCAGIRL